MIRTGFVKEKKGDQLRVCFERPEACEGCKGCSQGLMPKKELLTVFGQAEVGDLVDVNMPEAQTLKASLLAYALPLALLLAGLGIGAALRLPDGWMLVCALAGLLAGALLARGIDLRLRRQPKWRPSVVNVYPMGATQTERK